MTATTDARPATYGERLTEPKVHDHSPFFREASMMIAEAEPTAAPAMSTSKKKARRRKVSSVVSWQKRFRIYKRDEYTCAYCGLNLRRDIATLLTATVDHVQPRCEGGQHFEDNLVTACMTCNGLKAGTTGMSLQEVRAIVAARRAELIVKTLAEVTETGGRVPPNNLLDSAVMLDEVIQLELLGMLARFNKGTRKLSRNLDGLVNGLASVERSIIKSRPRRTWRQWLAGVLS